MIKVEVIKSKFCKSEFFCFNCNATKDDCKELRFSAGMNNSNAVVICLCKDCRDQLKTLLSQEEQ